MERETRFGLATSSLARKHSTAELLPLVHWILPSPGDFHKSNLVPRGRLELPRAYAHHPLKMACLPIPPPRPGRGGRTRTRDLRFWRPLLFQLSYTPATALCQVPLGRLERPTRGLGNRCSIHLSYRGNLEIGGFEPPTSAMRTQRSPN